MSRQKLKQINADRAALAQERRAKILRLGAEGMSTEAIAAEVGVSPKTVANTRSLARSEVSEKSEAIRTEADSILRGLADFAMQSEEMTDKEIVDAVRSCWQDLSRLHGANAPERMLIGVAVPNRVAAELRQIAADQRMTVDRIERWINAGKDILEDRDLDEREIKVILIPGAKHDLGFDPQALELPAPVNPLPRSRPVPQQTEPKQLPTVIDSDNGEAVIDTWNSDFGHLEE
jgi:hypothetical protein